MNTSGTIVACRSAARYMSWHNNIIMALCRNTIHCVTAVFRALLTVMGFIILTSCTTPSPKARFHTSTGFKVFVPSGAEGYHIATNQSIVIGAPLSQTDPIYPSSLVTRHIPPQHVCLEIEINTNGVVYGIKPLYGIAACPSGAQTVNPLFVAAAEKAAASWRFLPTHLCTFPKGVDARTEGTNCTAKGAKVEQLAIKLAFVFTFSNTTGVPTVDTKSMQ